MNDIYCPMIHGGLTIDLHSDGIIEYRHCCLIPGNRFQTDDINFDFFNSEELVPLRKKNLENIWDKKCDTCRLNEQSGYASFRTGMIDGLGRNYNLTGPTRLDLQFDLSCNLACRICGPASSTFWQKHLEENNLPVPVHKFRKSRADEMIHILSRMDLSNLKMVVFCGGETLLGTSYWQVTEYLAEVAPNITLCFQTNGTQDIKEKYYELIEKFDLVKLHISIDGVKEKFEYQRWPASWNQVTDNIFKIKENAPVNTMFLLEETLNIYNVLYQDELTDWYNNNFTTNRLGDPINHSKHLCNREFGLNNITQEYYDLLKAKNLHSLVPQDWQEKPTDVRNLVEQIKCFDKIRNQDFTKTFPEVAECYARYL